MRSGLRRQQAGPPVNYVRFLTLMPYCATTIWSTNPMAVASMYFADALMTKPRNSTAFLCLCLVGICPLAELIRMPTCTTTPLHASYGLCQGFPRLSTLRAIRAKCLLRELFHNIMQTQSK